MEPTKGDLTKLNDARFLEEGSGPTSGGGPLVRLMPGGTGNPKGHTIVRQDGVAA